MTKLEVMTKEHYQKIYDLIIKRLIISDIKDYDDFCSVFASRQGYVMIRKGEFIGAVYLSDWIPKIDAVLHCYVISEARRCWCNREIIKAMAWYIFEYLELNRVSSYVIEGTKEGIASAAALKALGFEKEGCKRELIKLNGKYHGVGLYGMLKSECKWL